MDLRCGVGHTQGPHLCTAHGPQETNPWHLLLWQQPPADATAGRQAAASFKLTGLQASAVPLPLDSRSANVCK